MPVPHGELWKRCKREIGSKATFTRYLRSLEDRKLIAAKRASRKNVTFTLNLGDRRARYLNAEIEELARYATPRSPMARDFQSEIRELKGAYHWRLVKAAEAISVVGGRVQLAPPRRRLPASTTLGKQKGRSDHRILRASAGGGSHREAYVATHRHLRPSSKLHLRRATRPHGAEEGVTVQPQAPTTPIRVRAQLGEGQQERGKL